MELLTQDDFETLHQCPWDAVTSEGAEFLYQDDMGCDVVRCPSCGVVYARRRLNGKGLPKYWSDYLSRVHVHDLDAVEKRNKMYQIDYAFSSRFVPFGKVLDVGCGNGSFMEVYEKHGYDVIGVEYGQEAATFAEKQHRVRYGIFDEMDFQEEKFDLIIFRGVLQYVPYPKKYLKKAVGLLAVGEGDRSGGHLFITAQPNMKSLGFRLFGKNFTQPVNGVDFIGLNERVLTEYLTDLGGEKVGEQYFYLETPYADEEADLLKMAKAVQYKGRHKEIDFKAPAYWGNMMTLIYSFRNG